MRAAFTVERSAPACPARIFLAALRAGENKLRESRPIAFLCAAVISFSIMSPSIPAAADVPEFSRQQQRSGGRANWARESLFSLLI
jgi:hypothetical protein